MSGKRPSQAQQRRSVRLLLEELESRLVPSFLPRPSHVVVVIEENRSFSEIIGSPNAPYINSLAAQGALMTNSFAPTHPSQPNYLDLFSGSNQGVTDDSCGHSFSAANLASELIGAGLSFGGYSESMPSVGYTGCTFNNNLYAAKHNPWVHFTNVPANDNLPFAGYFPADFSQLPTLAIVVPNQQDDMHDGTIEQADAWLQSNLGTYVQWAQANNSLLVVTWDEDDGSSTNQIATLFVGPMVLAGQYGETINHFNVLRTLEDMYNLTYASASAGAAPIIDIWQVTAQNFVQSLYMDFLGRSGSPGEIANWVAALPQVGRAAVVNGIARSPEAFTRLVNSLYVRFLGRPVDPFGQQAWLGLLESGGTEEQVLEGILSSGEFASVANSSVGSTNTDYNYVSALYSLLLNRTAGSAEVNGWLNVLPGAGRAAVAVGFLNSAEFRGDAVRSFYGDPSLSPLPAEPFFPNLLRRASAPATWEVAFWVDSSLDLLGIEAGFAESQEYFMAAQLRL
jgi:acid phosphatase